MHGSCSSIIVSSPGIASDWKVDIYPHPLRATPINLHLIAPERTLEYAGVGKQIPETLISWSIMVR